MVVEWYHLGKKEGQMLYHRAFLFVVGIFLWVSVVPANAVTILLSDLIAPGGPQTLSVGGITFSDFRWFPVGSSQPILPSLITVEPVFAKVPTTATEFSQQPLPGLRFGPFITPPGVTNAAGVSYVANAAAPFTQITQWADVRLIGDLNSSVGAGSFLNTNVRYGASGPLVNILSSNTVVELFEPTRPGIARSVGTVGNLFGLDVAGVDFTLQQRGGGLTPSIGVTVLTSGVYNTFSVAPEPPTIAIVAIGLVLMGLKLRCKKRHFTPLS
jgi:hypothetical protein